MMAGPAAMPGNLTRRITPMLPRAISKLETSAEITRLGGRMNHRGGGMNHEIKEKKNQQ